MAAISQEILSIYSVLYVLCNVQALYDYDIQLVCAKNFKNIGVFRHATLNNYLYYYYYCLDAIYAKSHNCILAHLPLRRPY